METGVHMFLSSYSEDAALVSKKTDSLGFAHFRLPEHTILPVNTASLFDGTVTKSDKDGKGGGVVEAHHEIIVRNPHHGTEQLFVLFSHLIQRLRKDVMESKSRKRACSGSTRGA